MQQWPQDWKWSVFILIPKKGNAKECSNYHTSGFISHTSKIMLKILQARLQQYWIVNFQMFKLVLEKAEEPEIKLPTSVGSSKKQEFHKNIYFCFIDYAKAFDYVYHNKLWEILQEMGWKKHKLGSRLLGEISIIQICRWYHLYGRKLRGTKKSLDEIERGEWKSWLKTQHSEN